MSTHILSVTIAVANSEVQELQKITIPLSFLPEEDVLIVELRKAWTEYTKTLEGQAIANPGDLFALG